MGPAGWAVYLGCSWTWCIGMFLPALLIRDLGLWGYVVFAVPNVVGAAAMGWVLKSPESSRRLVEWHKPAAVLFSRVTILFHFFWIAWVATAFGDLMGLEGWLELTLLVVGFIAILFVANLKSAHIAAMLIWLVSAGLLIFLATTNSVRPSTASVIQSIPFSTDAVWLLSASLFGFAFCPYLDLTFHHARQNCTKPSDSRFAFGLGFGAFFFSMIVLTFLYAGVVIARLDPNQSDVASIAPYLGIWLAVHIFAQAAFTYRCHRVEMERQGHSWSYRGLYFNMWDVALFVVLIAAFFPALPLVFENRFGFDMSFHEIIYRLFLTFYGLIFPTYVYLNIWDVRQRALRRQTRRSLMVTLIAIVLASPFFFMGFFVRDERFIPFGVAILLAAKLFTGRDDRPAPIARPA